MANSERQDLDIPFSGDVKTSNASTEDWQNFYLLRFERLLKLRYEFDAHPENPQAPQGFSDNEKLKLLNKATFLAWRECFEHKVGDAAKKLFNRNDSKIRV